MRNIFTTSLSLLITFLGTFVFGQNTADSLYTLRRTQAQSGIDYKSTEEAIFSTTGNYPMALVTLTNSAEGKTFVFTTYKNITADMQDQIEQRLLVSIPGLQSVNIENKHVSAFFNTTATEENILVFLKILGYDNYEVK